MVPTLVEFGLLITALCAAGKVVADMLPVYLKQMRLRFENCPVFARILNFLDAVLSLNCLHDNKQLAGSP
jgi:hypothetical protein